MELELNPLESSALYAALLSQVGSMKIWISRSEDQAEIDDLCKIVRVLQDIIDKVDALCPE